VGKDKGGCSECWEHLSNPDAKAQFGCSFLRREDRTYSECAFYNQAAEDPVGAWTAAVTQVGNGARHHRSIVFAAPGRNPYFLFVMLDPFSFFARDWTQPALRAYTKKSWVTDDGTNMDRHPRSRRPYFSSVCLVPGVPGGGVVYFPWNGDKIAFVDLSCGDTSCYPMIEEVETVYSKQAFSGCVTTSGGALGIPSASPNSYFIQNEPGSMWRNLQKEQFAVHCNDPPNSEPYYDPTMSSDSMLKQYDKWSQGVVSRGSPTSDKEYVYFIPASCPYLVRVSATYLPPYPELMFAKAPGTTGTYSPFPPRQVRYTTVVSDADGYIYAYPKVGPVLRIDGTSEGYYNFDWEFSYTNGSTSSAASGQYTYFAPFDKKQYGVSDLRTGIINWVDLPDRVLNRAHFEAGGRFNKTGHAYYTQIF
jgi:hypothetical protein